MHIFKLTNNIHSFLADLQFQTGLLFSDKKQNYLNLETVSVELTAEYHLLQEKQTKQTKKASFSFWSR